MTKIIDIRRESVVFQFTYWEQAWPLKPFIFGRSYLFINIDVVSGGHEYINLYFNILHNFIYIYLTFIYIFLLFIFFPLTLYLYLSRNRLV